SDFGTLPAILRDSYERQHLLRELDAAKRTSERAAREWRLLVEVGKVLAQDVKTAIPEAAQLLVPDAADCFALGVVGTEEVPTLVEASHVDPHLVPELQARLRELVAHSGGAADQLLGHVRHGEVIHSEQTRAAHWAFLAGLDVASGVAAPLE